MQTMVIPTIEFRQANIVDVINYLRDASEAQDPEKAGVNIILNVEGSGPAAAETPAPAPTDDPWGAADAGATAAPAGGGMSGIPAITLNLRRVSLLDAIKYVTEIAGLKYRIEDRAVIITPANQASGTIVTRMYPVQPSILDVITTREEDTAQQQDRGTGNFVQMGAQTVTQKRSDARAFFEKAGVPFPAGSSITYNSSISQLIVANTAENLEIFERLLAQLNVIPSQIEIEARFVEIAQNDLEELGFQWFLTDNYEVATKKGGTLGGQQAVVMNANAAQGGFTKGLRYFDLSETGVAPAAPNGTAGMLGSLLSVSSILTNPELTVVLHALSQKGGVDLLSAPRVTTRSGVQAQIQVVREIIYPTEFETSEPTVAESGAMVSPPVVTPGSFETRETGVILNVTPTVGPDGYTIDLAMVPEVAELVDWIQYGSTINLDANRSFTFNIPQPVFASRNVQTSIVVWDGQTVVMGGLIREQMSRIKDKVPLLGDIPLLGRLFRSEGEYSQKQNLLIFVTARLVDPSGAPLRKGGESATISATTK